MIVAFGNGLIGTLAVALPLQPFDVTVTPRATLPAAPATKLIALVLAPEVIVPLVMVHV